MISTVIRCPYKEELKQLFITEDTSFQGGRSRYRIEKEGDELCFYVEAQDFVALRAMLNAITKNLSIFTKMESMVNNE